MHRFILGSLFILVSIGVTMTLPKSARAEEKSDKILRHVVCFKFKEGTPEAKVREIEAAFAALPEKIDAIRDFEWGTNNSPENLAAGYTHCFLVTFADEAGRAAYLPHPAHQAFVALLKPHLDKAFVIDYWAER